MVTNLLKALLWVLPYFAAGFAAPVLFSFISSRQTAGHIAGLLFVAAGIYAVVMARKNSYSTFAFFSFALVLVLQVVFWSWRFFEGAPLAESALLGLSGRLWHNVLTSLFLLCGLTFIFEQFQWLNKKA